MWELKNGNITFDIVENAFIHSTKGYLHWNLIITTVIVVNISVKLVSCLFIVSVFVFFVFFFYFILVSRLRHNVLFYTMVADISNAYGRHCVAFLFNSDTLYLMRTIFQAPCVIIAFSLSLSLLLSRSLVCLSISISTSERCSCRFIILNVSYQWRMYTNIGMTLNS